MNTAFCFTPSVRPHGFGSVSGATQPRQAPAPPPQQRTQAQVRSGSLTLLGIVTAAGIAGANGIPRLVRRYARSDHSCSTGVGTVHKIAATTAPARGGILLNAGINTSLPMQLDAVQELQSHFPTLNAKVVDVGNKETSFGTNASPAKRDAHSLATRLMTDTCHPKISASNQQELLRMLDNPRLHYVGVIGISAGTLSIQKTLEELLPKLKHYSVEQLRRLHVYLIASPVPSARQQRLKEALTQLGITVHRHTDAYDPLALPIAEPYWIHQVKGEGNNATLTRKFPVPDGFWAQLAYLLGGLGRYPFKEAHAAYTVLGRHHGIQHNPHGKEVFQQALLERMQADMNALEPTPKSPS